MKCPICGEEVFELESFEVDGESLEMCFDCMHANYESCDYCSRLFRPEDLRYVEPDAMFYNDNHWWSFGTTGMLCSECYERSMEDGDGVMCYGNGVEYYQDDDHFEADD